MELNMTECSWILVAFQTELIFGLDHRHVYQILICVAPSTKPDPVLYHVVPKVQKYALHKTNTSRLGFQGTHLQKCLSKGIGNMLVPRRVPLSHSRTRGQKNTFVDQLFSSWKSKPKMRVEKSKQRKPHKENEAHWSSFLVAGQRTKRCPVLICLPSKEV